MNKIYFDNAATTAIDSSVVDAMIPVMRNGFGNPSSTHSFGRSTRSLIEKARKDIAERLQCAASEIYFTSGGTEADNQALHLAVYDLGVERIITSPIEHHAVVHTAEYLASRGVVELELLRVQPNGDVDLNHLEELLESDKKTLVSLMHANNEIGNLLDLHRVGTMCKERGAYFHSDTVQSMAHFNIDLSKTPVDFITCSAHKFHGPKGVGFFFARKGIPFKAFIQGGAQERDRRGGTENVPGIVGLHRALIDAIDHHEEHVASIKAIKQYFIDRLRETIPNVAFNGTSDSMDESLYTVLNVSLPPCEMAGMLLFHLDLHGIAASGGSACSAGSSIGSHVLTAIGADPNRPAIRFSFSKYNTHEEVDFAIEKLAALYTPKQEMA